MENLLILFCFWLFLTLGCGTYKSIGDGDAPKVERGRLKFAKKATHLNVGREPIYRDVEQNLYVNGKKWSPEGEPKFADKLNWCDTSPNPKVEILRCFGDASENYQTTYILRMNGDKPEIQKINEGLPSVWINDDGRWLLFGRFYLNVESGEKKDFQVMSFVEGEEGAVLVQYVLGVSPDMKTIVVMPDSSRRKEGAEEFVTIWIVDTETGNIEKRKVSFTRYPWVKDHENPDNDIQPPPAPSKKLVWEKDANGRDRLIVPQLLEKIGK